MEFVPESRKGAHPVFIAGIRYSSLCDADLDSGIRAVSIWKALKKTRGFPAMVCARKYRSAAVLVVTELWINNRLEDVRRQIPL